MSELEVRPIDLVQVRPQFCHRARHLAGSERAELFIFPAGTVPEVHSMSFNILHSNEW